MNYFKKEVLRLDPYVPGFQPVGNDYIKLNTNENPFPPSEKVVSSVKKAVDGGLKLYPDPLSSGLVSAAAGFFKVKTSNIMAGNGSDEIISIIFKASLGRADTVAVTFPTYSLYNVLAGVNGAAVKEYFLKEQTEIPEKMIASRAKLIILSNPNAPTGCAFDKADIERLCASNTGSLIVIDEAYADFAENNYLYLIKKHRNVIITRSMSKSFSLAGARLGFAVSCRENIEVLLKVKDSYNVNRLSARAGKAAFEDKAYFAKTVSAIKRNRAYLTINLEKQGYLCLPSQANFVFAKPPHGAEKLVRLMRKKKILIRHFNSGWLRDFVRISVGEQKEMDKFLAESEKINKAEG
ncbi:MAG: histidinol-phosphate transaminase [Candidatus Aureabacteria bacterium]|nr:histidinol-phosphate transaminase [Candidatus Auribacterota bacterium]